MVTYSDMSLNVSGNGVENTMESKIINKEKVKDINVKDDIRTGNFGENKDEIKPDVKNNLKHIPYNPKADPRNAQNTVSAR